MPSIYSYPSTQKTINVSVAGLMNDPANPGKVKPGGRIANPSFVAQSSNTSIVTISQNQTNPLEFVATVAGGFGESTITIQNAMNSLTWSGTIEIYDAALEAVAIGVTISAGN